MRLTTTVALMRRNAPAGVDNDSVWREPGGVGATATSRARRRSAGVAPTITATAAAGLPAPSAAAGRPLPRLALAPARSPAPFFGAGPVGVRAGHRQIGLSQQGERDVPVPPRPAPHLILIQPHLPFRALDTFLDRPAGPRYPHQRLQRGVRRAVADVVGPVGRVAQAPSDQQPVPLIRARQRANRPPRPIIAPGPLRARPGAPPLPVRRGHLIGQRRGRDLRGPPRGGGPER